MAGFGIIHELADIEAKVRREAMGARHQAHSAKMFAEQYNTMDREKIDQMVAMLDAALTHLSKIIGE